jgi:predicted ABC-type ATPase
MAIVNTDEIAKVKYLHKTNIASQETQKEAHEMYHSLIHKGESFCYETVFSHVSKVEFSKATGAR